eukprot:CAMPEP_0114973630 /NCGR_PEP_ID=MMETSP0216-20121206/1068_1 /TAXON_ID=223996 /ORGANISM="Protocruzia adherens, Strain Boccale" /LENGTH=202 /DNA_ID=CAMNT_0002334157 /DNA_START=38 /DNA_END=646 /DNA_ORIENTATION=-
MNALRKNMIARAPAGRAPRLAGDLDMTALRAYAAQQEKASSKGDKGKKKDAHPVYDSMTFETIGPWLEGDRTMALMKSYEIMRNNNRFTRPGLSGKQKKTYVKHQKEYAMFNYQSRQEDYEVARRLKKIRRAAVAALEDLPPNLKKEALSEGEMDCFENIPLELSSNYLFLEQLLEIMPYEISDRWKITAQLKKVITPEKRQ